ncbi:MAG: hypothetical protein RIA69_08535 [Cyclobacteriaceae bacterium]
MTNLKAGFLLTFLFFGLFSTKSQESAKDEYADYSYLWEDSKKKKTKNKKEKNTNQTAQKNEVSQQGRALTENTLTAADTGNQQNNTNLIDENSTDNESLIRKSASESSQTINEQLFQTDTLDKEPIEQPQIAADSVKEEQSMEEKKLLEPEEEPTDKADKKKESFTQPDFRSPMGGGSSSSGGGSLNGGFTMTLIDDQYYAGLTLQPEFSIGKVGVGLNVPILFGLEDQKVRTEMFKDGVGVARLVSYIRYGVQKRDPLYVKVGQLNNTMIGFGGLINNYTNTTSFEKRKVGVHYDVNYQGYAGIEGMYSDFNASSFNLFALRPYVRPFSRMPIPIIKTTEFGLTFIRDADQTSTGDTQYTFTEGGIGAFGIDMGLTLLSIPFLQIDFFANYGRLNVESTALTDSLTVLYAQEQTDALSDGFSKGSGASVGVNFRFHFIANILSTDLRIERLNYSEHYLPQFFNTTYELNKDARILALASAGKMEGIYGSVQGHILQKIIIGGSLMIPDNISEASPAFVEVNANLDRLADKISVNGSYFKGNLTDLSDAFSLDENSLAQVRVMYHLNKWMAAGMDYYWAFTPTENGRYEATQYVAPYFGLSISF